MAWFVRIDRYGSVHLVRSQDTVMKGGADSSNSCGIASILMVNFKEKKYLMAAGVAAGAGISTVPVVGTLIGQQLSQAAIDWAIKSEPEIYRIYSDVTGTTYDGSTYSTSSFFPEVLRRLGLGEWEDVDIPDTGIFDAIKAATDKGSPVIVWCKWNNGSGAHFMVVDETHSLMGSTISVCDPWDGELRIVPAKSGQIIDYDPNGFVWSFSLGGNRHKYSAPSPGKIISGITRKK
jgi:hypothetical protein